jgi:ATP adenylyltransferase
MEHLWSPWRMEYLRAADKASGGAPGGTGCIFCDKPASGVENDIDNLILHRGPHAYAILNLYPYNNGHLMVVPYAHVPSLEQLDPATLTDVMLVVNQGLAALRTLYTPQAFNLGMNIGAAAGAGIAEHVHMHVVPRWVGDTNFMTAVSGTRVIPEDLRDTVQRLRAAWPA